MPFLNVYNVFVKHDESLGLWKRVYSPVESVDVSGRPQREVEQLKDKLAARYDAEWGSFSDNRHFVYLEDEPGKERIGGFVSYREIEEDLQEQQEFERYMEEEAMG